MTDGQVGLSDAIRALRAELTSAMEEGASEALRFELGPVEMEFLLEVRREAGGEAGVKFWVANLGGKASQAVSSTNRVKLQLNPQDAHGKRPVIRDIEK
ncbi:trypco2 family protein [Herbidospora sp. RD11066]